MPQRNEIYYYFLGIFLVFIMHFLAILLGVIVVNLSFSLGGTLSSLVSSLLLYALFGFGLSQLVYIIPVIIWARRQQRWGLMKGVIIGAVLTALLNGGCWIFFASVSV